MARVLALTRDLLFGSRVQGALQASGHEVELVDSEARVRERLAASGESAATGEDVTAGEDAATGEDAAARAVDALVIDLTDPELDGAAIVASLKGADALGATRTLAFYSHVDAPARERAERAGIDVVVPRSRMAREGPELLARLLER
jgi:DNA-binding NarL/FixJ family response regulator